MRRHRLMPLTIALMLLLSLMPLAFAAQPGEISGYAFNDRDMNGVMNGREGPFGGVEVSLISTEAGQEQQVAHAVTDGEGRYHFAAPAPGQYYLRVLLPEGYVPGPYEASGSRLIPSSSRESRTPAFSYQSGERLKDVYLMGVMQRKQGSFVRATAFGDSDLNGGRFSNEPFLRDVQLELLFELDGVYYPVGSASTNKEGIGEINNVAPGHYVLAATLPGSWIIGPIGKKINPFYNTILPTGDNYGRSAPFRLPPRGSIGMGVGGATTGAGAGRVWMDSNHNGKLDADEAGVAGIRILLEHVEMGVQHELATEESGLFEFSKLHPGSYRLTAELPEHLMFTVPGGQSIMSNDSARKDSASVNVLADGKADFGQIGLMTNTSLKLLAFHDSNVNGWMDEGEPAFAGARLTVHRQDRQVAEAVSDANGVALIPLIRGGDLRLSLSLPDGQIFSVSGGEGGNAFFDQRAADSLSIPYALPHGQESQLLAGVTLPAQVSGLLFEDMNSNALMDQGEAPVQGFAVQALTASGEVLESTETDQAGRYHFPRLIPGGYQLRILLQSPYIFSGTPQANAERVNRFTSQTADYGETEALQLQPGQHLEAMDGAVFRSGVIEGDVLLGDERDGFAGDQGGLEGVLVELLDEEGKPVSDYTVATTDQAGHFLLKGALPGQYSLSYTLPQGAAFSRPLTEERSIAGEMFAVKASDELSAPTLFAVQTGSIAGKAYLDMNVNGQLDEGDLPLPGALLEMQSEVELNSRGATSGEDGSFLLEGLRPGDYRLQLDLPEGKLISLDEKNPVAPAISSSSSADIRIGMGQEIPDMAIAAVNSHALSGRAYFDNNLNRLPDEAEPGYQAPEIRLRHELSKVEFKAQPDSEGRYTIPVLFPGSYQVSLDLPPDFELYAPKGAGKARDSWELPLQLSAAEAGTAFDLGLVQFGSMQGQLWDLGGGQGSLEGVALKLTTAAGADVADTSTDAQGRYQFDGLYPGQYVVKAKLPEGFRFAREIDSQRTRFSLITSDGSPVEGSRGSSNAFILAMAEHKQGQDIGMGTLGQLGDYAWLDLDGDGMQDAGEPGVPGIQIRIYQHDQLAQETVTDAFGRYLFKEVYPGSYRLEATIPAELKATRRQTEFRLVASILPEEEGPVISVDGVMVPSGGRNLNADLGFALRQEGRLPASMHELPQKDWTLLVPVEPKRSR